MRFRSRLFEYAGSAVLAALLTGAPSWAQDPNQGQYPPPQDPQQQQAPPPQYPPQGQYPPPAQYPQTQAPPQQNPYPQQGQYPAPPRISPAQLDQLVAPIALYPDGLLAQILTASTYGNELPDAAGWANAHQYLKGDALAQAIQADNLNFDPSVMALLPFPSVLDYMARYPAWTQALGNAVLAQRDEVMDAVQRRRQEAYNYGYLQNSQYWRVDVAGPGAIQIVPVNPGFYYVPYYNPLVVYARPRPGFFLGGAIRFGGGITIGSAFAPWGWGGAGFGWREHTILVDHRPWGRDWDNRRVYVHPYAEPYRRVEGPRVEHHEAYHDDHHGDYRHGDDHHRDDHHGDDHHGDDHHH